jgi:hypothetical protein
MEPMMKKYETALVKRLEAIVQEAPATPWADPQTYLDAEVGEHVL